MLPRMRHLLDLLLLLLFVLTSLLQCGAECYLYDAASPNARSFIFDKIKTGYVDYGIKNFWFDASEPESLGGENHTVDGIVFHNPLGQPKG